MSESLVTDLKMQKLEDLVVQAQQGDGEAYGVIVDRFQKMALSCAFSVLGDYDLAEDARQEAFIGAYCDLLALRDPAAFPGWFRKIVLKHSIRIRRGRKFLSIPLEDAGEIEANTPDPSEEAVRKDKEDRVRQAIERLPRDEREIVRLYYLERQSLREIAQALELSEKLVKSRLHAGRGRLRLRLVEMVKKSVREQNLKGDRQALQAASTEAIDQFDRQLASLLHFPTKEEQEKSADLLCAKGRLHRFMGQHREAFQAFETGLNLPALAKESFHRARFISEAGLTHIQLSEYGEAANLLKKAAQVVKTDKRAEGLTPVINNGLGMCAWCQGDFRKARSYYRLTIEACGKQECPVLEAEACNNLALLDWKDGRLTDALDGFKSAMKRWKSLKNRFGWALSLMNIGIMEEGMGRLTLAAKHYSQALNLAQEIGYAQLETASLANLSNLSLLQRHWKKSMESAQQALEVAKRIGDQRSQAIALENISLSYLGLRKFPEAKQAIREAAKIAKKIGDAERIFSLELVGAEGEIEQGLLDNLLQILTRLSQEAEKKYKVELPRTLRLRARVEWLEGREKKALASLEAALKQSREQKNKSEETKILELGKHLKEMEGGLKKSRERR